MAFCMCPVPSGTWSLISICHRCIRSHALSSLEPWCISFGHCNSFIIFAVSCIGFNGLGFSLGLLYSTLAAWYASNLLCSCRNITISAGVMICPFAPLVVPPVVSSRWLSISKYSCCLPCPVRVNGAVVPSAPFTCFALCSPKLPIVSTVLFAMSPGIVCIVFTLDVFRYWGFDLARVASASCSVVDAASTLPFSNSAADVASAVLFSNCNTSSCCNCSIEAASAYGFDPIGVSR